MADEPFEGDVQLCRNIISEIDAIRTRVNDSLTRWQGFTDDPQREKRASSLASTKRSVPKYFIISLEMYLMLLNRVRTALGDSSIFHLEDESHYLARKIMTNTLVRNNITSQVEMANAWEMDSAVSVTAKQWKASLIDPSQSHKSRWSLLDRKVWIQAVQLCEAHKDKMFSCFIHLFCDLVLEQAQSF